MSGSGLNPRVAILSDALRDACKGHGNAEIVACLTAMIGLIISTADKEADGQILGRIMEAVSSGRDMARQFKGGGDVP